MRDFVLLFRTNEKEQREHMGTPEAAQKSMAGWLEWVRSLEAAGHMKDYGQPLDMGGAVLKGKKRVVTDGPFTEVKDVVAGFMVICARDLEEAKKLASGCPMLDGEGTVEVRPVGTFPA